MRIVFLFLFQLFLISSFAQKQAAIWYFGEYAGLAFTIEGPVNLQNSALSTTEGSASISDANGDLLLYTDGVTVYNKNHQPMKNGRNLWGHYSTTQTLIVPQPENDSIFYVFTISPQYNAIFADDSVGCHFSIININRENGQGEVILKNKLLFKNSTEKITAVHHANSTDTWVITHEWGTNCFRSYLVSSTNSEMVGISSCIGAIHLGGGALPGDNADAIGQMKVSPDGSTIALVLSRSKKLEVLSFNKSTGQISNLITTVTNFDQLPVGNYYGLEFSPNSKFIYITVTMGCGSNLSDNPSQVWQYSIEKQKITKVGSFIGSLNSMQLGLDGRIYISRCNYIKNESDYLAVIDNPSREGLACNFVSKGVSLGGRKNTLGLPNFIQSYFLFEEPVIDMPNVFTPNGDDYNPLFEPVAIENMLEADLRIINRWGNEVYYTSDVRKGWDGGDEPSGVYYWLMRYEGKNGKTGTRKGWVHLIR
jgi:gliding motility-associated-like protein